MHLRLLPNITITCENQVIIHSKNNYKMFIQVVKDYIIDESPGGLVLTSSFANQMEFEGYGLQLVTWQPIRASRFYRAMVMYHFSNTCILSPFTMIMTIMMCVHDAHVVFIKLFHGIIGLGSQKPFIGFYIYRKCALM